MYCKKNEKNVMFWKYVLHTFAGISKRNGKLSHESVSFSQVVLNVNPYSLDLSEKIAFENSVWKHFTSFHWKRWETIQHLWSKLWVSLNAFICSTCTSYQTNMSDMVFWVSRTPIQSIGQTFTARSSIFCFEVALVTTFSENNHQLAETTIQFRSTFFQFRDHRECSIL